MITLTDHESAAVQPSSNIAAQIGACVGMAALLVYFIGLSPFSDLSDPRMLDETLGREAPVYFLVLGLAATGASCLYLRHLSAAISVHFTKYNAVLLAWLGLTVILSSDPNVSLRRLVLTIGTFLVASMLPWLVKGPRQLMNLLIAIAFLVLYLSYMGVAMMPNLAIHQSSDLAEPLLAGDWRGIYEHKNLTAEVMAVFVLIGWFVARMGRPLIGVPILLSALVFLYFSGGKSALGILLFIAVIAFFVIRARTLQMRAIIIFAPLLLAAFLTVGSTVSDVARSIVEHLPGDSTFTGRTDIWRFAMTNMMMKPVTGYGFEAFWHTNAVVYGSEDPTQWAGTAHTSHNGYLDLALTIGLPGLFLAGMVFLIVPLRNFHHTLHHPANRSFAQLFLTIWLFLIYMSLFEAFILSRADPMWFMFAFVTCGLNCTSKFMIEDEDG
jgi:O-antigen ligase